MSAESLERAQIQSLLGSAFEVLEIRDREVKDECVWARTEGAGWSLAASEEDARLGALEASSGIGRDGLFWINGLAEKDRNPRFTPMIARGSRFDHGDYWHWYLSDSDLQGALESKESELLAGSWTIEIPHLDDAGPGAQRAAKRQIDWLYDRIDLDGQSWQQHIHEVLLSLATGFTLFEEVWSRDHSVDLQWRWPSQVERWMLDERKSRVLAVQLYEQDKLLPMERALHYRWGAFGVDPEGNPPLRALGMLIDLKQQFQRGAAIGFGAFAVPWLAIEKTQPSTSDAGDDRRESLELRRAQGTDRMVINLKYGHKLVVVQAAGQMPDALPMIRYIDEKIRQRLRDDATLLGSGGGGGSHALAQQRESDKLRSSYHLARWIGATYSEQVIKRMMKRAGKLPLSARQWPRLKYDLGLEDGKIDAASLAQLRASGLLVRTPQVVEQVHKMYGFDVAGIEEAMEQEEVARAEQAEAMKQRAEGGAGGDEDKNKDQDKG